MIQMKQGISEESRANDNRLYQNSLSDTNE